jgi:hypothetical protein
MWKPQLWRNLRRVIVVRSSKRSVLTLYKTIIQVEVYYQPIISAA